MPCPWGCHFLPVVYKCEGESSILAENRDILEKKINSILSSFKFATLSTPGSGFKIAAGCRQ